jgi:hypothetical protein
MAHEKRARIEIEDGPGKFELMLSLFDRSRGRRPVFFQLAVHSPGRTTSASIDLVQSEDRLGESWSIAGFAGDSEQQFDANYSTKTRKGSLRFLT